MSFPDCIDMTTCVRLMQALGHLLWQGVFVFLLLGLAMSLMRRSSPSARYTVSLMALLLLAICPAVTFVRMGQKDIASAPRVAVQPSVVLSPASVIPKPSGESLPVPLSEPSAIAERRAPLIDWKQYAPYMAMGYLLGVVIMLGRLFLALQGGRRLSLRSEPVEDPQLLVALARQAKALGLAFTPAIGYCRHIVVPTVVGVLRPMILLPISLSTGLSDEQIEALLVHELAHIRRYDPLVHILQRLIEAVLFFHPCVWLISRRIRIERELCCDDLVLAEGIEDTIYVDSLLQMAKIVLASRNDHSLAAVATIGVADHHSPLRQRILRLIENPAYKPIRLASRFNFALILLGLVTTLAVVQLAALGNYENVGNTSLKPIVDRNVYILGQVLQPGAYSISEGQDLTLMELIEAAGGYDGHNIEHASIMLSSYGEDDKRQIIRKLDLITLTENEGEDILLRKGDFVTLSSEPLYRPQYRVSLVVGADRMTFEGQDTTWGTLPTMLQEVPNRPYTVFRINMAEDNAPTAEQIDFALSRAHMIIEEYGFEAHGFAGIVPLGDQIDLVRYIPVESMHYSSKESIPIDAGLLQTHTATPPGRPRHHVRLVIGADRMTFEGKDVTWDTLPAILQAVPNRDQTIIEIAIASDSPPGDKFDVAEARASELQKQFGFEQLWQTGLPQPLGSVGSLTRYVADDDVKMIP